MDQPNQRDFSSYVPRSYYSIGRYPGQVPVEAIFTRVYGRPFSIIEASSMDNEGLANDTLVSIDLSNQSAYEEALEEFDSKEITLGYDSNWRPIKKIGLTAMEYWLSISYTQDLSEVTHPGDTGIQDLEGATLLQWDGRVPTPGLRSIIADLIRRGEIPRGDYLFYHSW